MLYLGEYAEGQDHLSGERCELEVDPFLGESIAILGVKGSGKSTSAAVIIEEMLGAGIPVGIIDIAGEYWGLRQNYPITIIGRSLEKKVVDITIPALQPDEMRHLGSKIGEWSLNGSHSIIFDGSDMTKTERLAFLEGFLEITWRLSGTLRKPYTIVIDEAHNFIPQKAPFSGHSPLVVEIMSQIAAEGRKRGLGLVVIGQRTAKINKDVLGLTGIYLLHRTRYPNDMKVIQELLSSSRKWVSETIPFLETGQAVLWDSDKPRIVNMRQRYTYHAGYTPQLSDSLKPAPQSSEALRTLLEMDVDFQALMQTIENPAELKGTAVKNKASQKSGRLVKMENTSGIDPVEISLKVTNPETASQILSQTTQSSALVPERTEIDAFVNRMSITQADIQNVQLAKSWPGETSETHDRQKMVDDIKQRLDQLEQASDSINQRLDRLTRMFETVGEVSSQMVEQLLGKPALTTDQQQALEAFLDDLRQVKPRHRQLLAYLAVRENTACDLYIIGRAIGNTYDTLLNGLPHLVRWGLLEVIDDPARLDPSIVVRRGKKAKGTKPIYLYRSRLTAFLNQHFPGMDAEGLQQVMDVLQSM